MRALEETGTARFEVAVESPVQVDTAPHALIARAVKRQQLKSQNCDPPSNLGNGD